MKKSALISTFLFLMALIVLTSFSSSRTISKAGKRIDIKVLDNLETIEQVNVIIKYGTPELKINSLDNLNKNEIKNEIKNEFNVSYIASSFNGISITLNKKDLEKLEKKSYISEIKLEPEIRLFMQDSVDITNASSAWEIQMPENITGEGEVICVIDSGVNYSHQDFGGCTSNEMVNGNCNKIIGGYAFYNPVNSSEKRDVMDNNGHGTHVSGIVAANGVIKGIAPDSKIVMMKACGPTRSCGTGEVIESINWCVGNASVYNISVISMSLGDGLYENYCDGEDSDMTAAINSAIQKNISVIAATGNDGSHTEIAWPACIENVTSVGSVNKNDVFASDTNRNSITDLFGIGVNIYSTYLYEYATSSGTSMATPMVAGAFALVRQYKLLEGQILKPIEIQNALNLTGKIVTDSETGLNFSRIDVLSAIQYLDGTNPKSYLISPSNNMKTTLRNQTFSCNGTDLQLKNFTINLWNSTSLYYSNATEKRGTYNISEWNLLLDYENYEWNCIVCDEQNNCNTTSNNSLSVKQLIVNLISPSNNSYTNSGEHNFTCNVSSELELSNFTFYLWNSSSLLYNLTQNISGTTNESEINYTFSIEEGYKWNCLAVNNGSYETFYENNYSITYDITNPLLEVISPENNSYYNKLKFNVSLSENGYCKFRLNNGENISLNQYNTTYFYYVNETSEGQHNASFYCNDSSGNFNESDLIFFNVNLSKPVIKLISPANSYSTTASSTTITFNFNVSDSFNITECKLLISNSSYLNTSAISTSQTNTISKTLSSGTYDWKINCSNELGNENSSVSHLLTINSPAVTVSGGGGGGGSATKTYSISENQLNQGYEQNLRENDKIKFSYKNETHLIQIKDIKSGEIEIEISSEIIEAVIKLDEEKIFDLDGDSIGDLSVKLNSIEAKKANITIKKTDEILDETDREEKEENYSVETPDKPHEIINVENEKENNFILPILFIIAILIIILVLIYYFNKNKKKSNNKTESKKNEKNTKKKPERKKKISKNSGNKKRG